MARADTSSTLISSPMLLSSHGEGHLGESARYKSLAVPSAQHSYASEYSPWLCQAVTVNATV